MKEIAHLLLWICTAGYLFWGGAYFIQSGNVEFIFYVGFLACMFVVVFATTGYTAFPLWQLWLLSAWGLLFVLGGAVQTIDGILLVYKVYPFLDQGLELYVLTYDQIIQCYLYAVVAVMTYYVLWQQSGFERSFFVAILAVLVALGVGGIQEIMEFFVALSIQQHSVGGYANTLLDMVFNLLGAVLGVSVYVVLSKEWERLGTTAK